MYKMNSLYWIALIVLIINSVFAYNVNILKSDIDLSNTNLSNKTSDKILETISNISNYKVNGNEIIINFEKNINKEVKELIELIDDNAITTVNSKELKVNLPLLMTFADAESGNDVAKDISINNNPSTLERREVNMDRFTKCCVGAGVSLGLGCTWAAVFSGGLSCVVGGIGAMLTAGYCAVAYGANW